MKKILIMLAFIGLSLTAMGQAGGLYPYSTKTESYSQCWNVTSVYFNTPSTNVKSASALGNQIDTGLNATALVLSVSGWRAGFANADSFVINPLNGKGDITWATSLTKVTGTNPLITITYQSSTDGIRWGNIATDTVTLIASTQYTIKRTFPKQDRYYRASLTGVASSTYAAICGYYYLKSQFVEM